MNLGYKMFKIRLSLKRMNKKFIKKKMVSNNLSIVEYMHRYVPKCDPCSFFIIKRI